VPLFLAGLMFAGFEVSQRRHLLDRFAPERGVAISFEVPAMAALAGLAALTLVFIGALPPKPGPLDGAFAFLDEAASHFAASILGSLLLMAAYGLVRRLAIAWWAALFFLLSGALVAWLRGEPWWLTGGFLLLAGLLATVRPAFYRRARLMGEALTGETVAAVAALGLCALTLATVAYGGRFAEMSWWGVVLSEDAPNTLRFAVGLAGVLLLVAAFRLLRPARPPALPYGPEIRARLAAFGAAAPASADGAVLGEGGRAGFAFVKRDGIWLGLGDPAGEERDRVSAIWRFRDICERAGVDPAFWRVGPGLQRVYADIGLTPFPLEGDASRFLACRAEHDLAALLPLLPGHDDAP
jgi:phosphatidylglycerol lysyltransferase